MVSQLFGAIALAFFAILVFGKGFIPWLKRNGYVQPLKDEVQQRVYTEGEIGLGEKDN